MKALEIYRNGELAGILTQETATNYVFRYIDSYFANAQMPAVSLTLPKTKQEYHATRLFPFFCNLLSEGVNRRLQSRVLKIDEDDDFGLLSATARYDTVGAITVKPVQR